MQARNNVVALNQNSDLDLTLLGFTAIDIRTVNTGDVVIFRTASQPRPQPRVAAAPRTDLQGGRVQPEPHR